MATAREFQRIPVVVDAARVLALLDALAAGPFPAHGNGLINFHDRDGSVLAVVRMWCESRALKLAECAFGSDRSHWTAYVLELGEFTIAVHDSSTHQRKEPGHA